jgi:hypothetical protein
MSSDTLTEGTKDGRFSKVTNYTLVPLWQSANVSLGIPSFVILPYELAKRFLLSWRYSYRYRCNTPHRNPVLHSRVINSSATSLFLRLRRTKSNRVSTVGSMVRTDSGQNVRCESECCCFVSTTVLINMLCRLRTESNPDSNHPTCNAQAWTCIPYTVCSYI